MPEECDVDEIYLDRRYKVFIIFDDCSAPELEMKTEPLEGDLIKLPRIRGGTRVDSAYFVRRETDKLYDIMEISPTGPRSWFIDEMVVKRGGISVLTAADPLYVALEMFSLTTSRAVSGVGHSELSEDRYVSLSDICRENPEYPDLPRFFELKPTQENLGQILDVTHAEGVEKYKCDPNKISSWFRKKIDYILSHFEESKALLKVLNVKRKAFPLIDTQAVAYCSLRDAVPERWHHMLYDIALRPESVEYPMLPTIVQKTQAAAGKQRKQARLMS